MDPTAMICTNPRTIAIRALGFQMDFPPGASSTTKAANAATAA